jgi:hypothetical protein
MGSAEIARIHLGVSHCQRRSLSVAAKKNLREQEFHSRVQADFFDTPHGVAKKTRVVD